jgi:histidinol-phosphate phosphatase family protein
LCGGLGTRLKGILRDQPKVLAEVCGRPFLSYLLDQLADGGFRQVILATGHLGDQVRETFRDYYRGLHLSYSQEAAQLGTGGALRLAAWGLPKALVMNGDSYCDVNLPDLVLDHLQSGVPNSMAVVLVDDTRRFGSVQIGSGGLVTAFQEKAADGSDCPVSGPINAGIYVVSHDLIESIPGDCQVSLEHEVFPRWLGGPLRAAMASGPFLDIGTPESLVVANGFFQDRVGRGTRLVFLDRDGTVNVEREYLSNVDGMELLPGVPEAIRRLNSLGWPVVVVTNQAVVGRGGCSAETLRRINERLVELLEAEGAAVDGIYWCPHAPEEACACRKPKAGLLETAARVFGADLTRSFLVGDKWSNIQEGLNVGAVTFLVRTGHGAEPEQTLKCRPHQIAEDLRAAADQICRMLKSEHAAN